MPSHPTLINLPPPPSDPVTPSDIPGTPNSTTTSMSELSTVAIKDGHRGHLPHHRANAPDPSAERADRISRLAGLERVATARQPPNTNLTPGAVAPHSQAGYSSGAGYFDNQGNPVLGRERSTVGSASATGSVGGRTTWASGSVGGEEDKMSESAATADTGMLDEQGDVDMEMDRSSVGGISEEGTGSLVGFGEGARTPARLSNYGSPAGGGRGGLRGDSLTPTSAPVGGQGMEKDARMDGVAKDPVGLAERIVRERLGDEEGGLHGGGGRGLGKFEFEGK
ncbi:hypothetical protein KVT40_006716 [Elsinoe batatas]|uniref:Uncharacterized protein n=1 Tax=Elsinoe batatas TaxID=2601811 RepID=A0A8K0KX94_9PEZI|nr:hypothetical protein KVT40_006716 [Elsinoe batatas]